MGIFNFSVRPLCSYYRKVLPAVYDNSLSYYEQLCRIKYKLNEVIKNLNDLEENLPSYVKQAIDEALGGWEERMEEQFAEQNARIAAAEKKIYDSVAEMQAQLDAAIREMEQTINAQLNALYLILVNGINANRAYIDSQISLLKAEFPDLSTVYVISPVDGQLVKIQDCVNDMYNVLRYGALTAAQYDALQLTAKEYDDKSLTAFTYDMYGLCELWSYLNVHRMHSVTTGEIVAIPAGVYQLTDKVRTSGLTATAYDAKELTASGYDGKAVTAYNYDWSGVA